MQVGKQTSLFFALLVLLPWVATAQQSSAIKVYPGQYVVTVNALAASGLSAQSISDSIENSTGAQVLRELGGNSKLVSSGLFAASLNGDSASTVPYNENDDFCARIVKEHIVHACSPNFEIKIDAVPNDPKYSSLWGMTDIDAPLAWDVHTGTGDTVVAVIDTGVDYNHPDLVDNMWVNTAEIPGNGLDDDNNGYVDDVHGMNAVGTEGDPMDDNGHGSHCAGTIGGRGNNGKGVAGVTWRTKIMALKFLGANGSGSLAGAIEAIQYMVMMKNRGVNVRVSNNSWGGGGFSQGLEDAIHAADDAGIIFVAAAGNSANNNDANPGYPSSYDVPSVVGVAAIDSNHNLASFSNYGATSVDIAAPGVGILSTYKNGGYATLSGTSMATPHVSGLLALLSTANPSLSNGELIGRLYESGVDSSTLDGIVRTGRKINASRALRNQTDPLPEPEPEPSACSYTVEEISYTPDTSADSGELINQTDEYGFAQVYLPFQFPFHRDSTGSVIASPNGVIYMRNQPTSMDYRNGETAPAYSIAALHTDLKGVGNPYGVRYAGSSSKAVFSWQSQAYAYESLGDIRVRTALFPSGIIELYVEFSSENLREAIRKKATIGLNWNGGDGATTYAYNSTNIISGRAVRFTPDCSGSTAPAVKVDRLRAKGVNSRGRVRSQVRPKQWVRVQGFGAGSGNENVALKIDGVHCPGTLALPVEDGFGELYARLHRAARGYRTIDFILEGNEQVSARVRIKRGRNARRYKRRHRSSQSRKFQKSCSKILTTAFSVE